MAKFEGPYNGTPLVVLTATLSAVAVCLLAWRLQFRFSRHTFASSDALLVAATCCALCQAGFNVGAYINWGYGYHRALLPPEIAKAQTPKLLFWLNQIFFKASEGLAKLSICMVYLQLFKNPISLIPRMAQMLNYILLSVVASYYFAGTLVSIFQCQPVAASWNPKITAQSCIDLDRFRVANACMNIITSCWIIILPFPVILSLPHRNSERFQFLGLVGLGFIHTGCATYRLAAMYMPNPKTAADPQYYNTSSNIFAMLELFVGIIAATIITMRRCFQGFAVFMHTAVTNPSQALSSVGRKGSSSGQSKKSRSSSYNPYRHDAERAPKIAVTTELEMESTNRSTEGLYAPERAHYYPGSERETKY